MRDNLAVYSVSLLMGVLVVVSTGFISLGGTGDVDISFPFQDATVVYTVEGQSPMGQLFGTSTYTVKEVGEELYTVQVDHTGNLSRLPTFGDSQSEELGRDEPISFSSVVGASDLVESRIVEMGDKEIKVNKYFLETEKEYGTETISIFMPEQVKVPLIFDYKYGDRFQIHIELDKTNISYLQ
ncbi:MAG: hypothetical protein ACOC88_01485 [Candidatus Bipolaricaulota bacterium]